MHSVITSAALFVITVIFPIHAFVIPRQRHVVSSLSLGMANVGIFYGTSTGSTEDVADQIKEAFGDDADGPFDVDDLEGSVKENFEKYDAIVCGTPTWNTGADTERSGTGWDEIYYTSLSELNFEGKSVAVFGCGDQLSYAENFADATGELHDVFQNLGAKLFGYTSQEGYEHEASKSIRGDLFCGLLCDAVNQDELTGERVRNWVTQLKEEGFMQGAANVVKEKNVQGLVSEDTQTIFQDIDESSNILDENIKLYGSTSTGFKPFYNEKTKTTMFVSADGRSCYYVDDPSNASFSP